MSQITITLKGDKEIAKNLGGALLDGVAERLVKKTAIEGENQGKLTSPIDTGRLRASITHQTSGKTGWFGTNILYGKHLNSPRAPRNPHYRRERHAGGETAGWLTKRARDATEQKVPEIIEGEIRTIEKRWRS